MPGMKPTQSPASRERMILGMFFRKTGMRTMGKPDSAFTRISVGLLSV